MELEKLESWLHPEVRDTVLTAATEEAVKTAARN